MISSCPRGVFCLLLRYFVAPNLGAINVISVNMYLFAPPISANSTACRRQEHAPAVCAAAFWSCVAPHLGKGTYSSSYLFLHSSSNRSSPPRVRSISQLNHTTPQKRLLPSSSSCGDVDNMRVTHSFEGSAAVI